MWVKRFYQQSSASWKSIWKAFFCNFGNADLLLESDYDVDKLQHRPSEFIQDVVRCWALVHLPNKCLLWNNQQILIGGKSVVFKSFVNAGINLFSGGEPIAFEELEAKSLPKTYFF
jgi:hypothetical protein